MGARSLWIGGAAGGSGGNAMRRRFTLTGLSRMCSRSNTGLFVGGGDRVGGLRSWLYRVR
jgi:hypothetical protein